MQSVKLTQKTNNCCFVRSLSSHPLLRGTVNSAVKSQLSALETICVPSQHGTVPVI